MKLEKPKNIKKLVNLPYDKAIYLCRDTLTRWQKHEDYYIRDLDGESSWKTMGEYMGMEYKEVFLKEYKSAIGE